MSECSLSVEPPGDGSWNKKRIWIWILSGSALSTAIAAAFLVPAGLGILVLGAIVTGALLGGYIGNGWNWFFDRLKEQNPRTITISGLIVCKRRNLGGFSLTDPAMFGDGDWNFNVKADFHVLLPDMPGLDAEEVRTRAAPGSGQPQSYHAFQVNDPDKTQVLHTEISSSIGNFTAVGGVAGSIAGAMTGALLCALVIVISAGWGVLACLLLPALFTWLGGQLGGLIGHGLGEIVDELGDFDERGEVVEEGACMLMTGRWVTDKWHQWNEIHDVESAQIVECDADSGGGGVILLAAAGIGRLPTGRGQQEAM